VEAVHSRIDASVRVSDTVQPDLPAATAGEERVERVALSRGWVDARGPHGHVYWQAWSPGQNELCLPAAE